MCKVYQTHVKSVCCKIDTALGQLALTGLASVASASLLHLSNNQFGKVTIAVHGGCAFGARLVKGKIFYEARFPSALARFDVARDRRSHCEPGLCARLIAVDCSGSKPGDQPGRGSADWR